MQYEKNKEESKENKLYSLNTIDSNENLKISYIAGKRHSTIKTHSHAAGQITLSKVQMR